MMVNHLLRALPLFALAALVVAIGCKHEPPILPDLPEGSGTLPNDTSGPAPYESLCDSDTVYFQQAILPLIVSNCTGVGSGASGCHNAAHHAEGVRLYDYAHIMQQVHAGQPSNSHLLTHGIWETGNDQMPPDGPLSQAQIDLIVTWIEQGALNNGCTGGCDTSNVTYAGVIAPIIQANCAGSSCHDAVDPANSTDLTTYAGVLAIVNDGTLAGAIHHENGYTAMPPGLWLTQCQLDRIMVWIQQGAPNN